MKIIEDVYYRMDELLRNINEAMEEMEQELGKLERGVDIVKVDIRKDKKGAATNKTNKKGKAPKALKGEIPQGGDLLTVDYEGRLQDGTVFDSSIKRGKPFQFRLDKGQVIRG